MRLQFGLTDELTNTQFAPVAATAAFYEVQKVLASLQSVTSANKTRDFMLFEKLTQVMLSGKSAMLSVEPGSTIGLASCC